MGENGGARMRRAYSACQALNLRLLENLIHETHSALTYPSRGYPHVIPMGMPRNARESLPLRAGRRKRFPGGLAHAALPLMRSTTPPPWKALYGAASVYLPVRHMRHSALPRQSVWHGVCIAK